MGTGQTALTFPISVAIALPGGTGHTIAAIIEMADGMGAAYIRARHLHTAEPALTFTVTVTVT